MYNIIAMGSHTNTDTLSGYHAHDYWEFVYYFEGNGTICSEKATFTFHPYMLVCIPPHLIHTELPSGAFSNMYFITNTSLPLPDDRCFVYEDRVMHEIEFIFQQLRIQYFRRRGKWREINHALIALLLEMISSRESTGNPEYYVEIAENTIINHFSDKNFSLNDIYEKVPLAKEYFMTIFKQSTGMTPLEYLTDKRIENAKQLLRLNNGTRTPVSVIADLSGFNDMYYFSRVFKKQTGLSPLNWYKQQKKL